ncbi:MAG: hypothetical protein WCD57_19590 [Acidobacteriaceae bacterium]
MTYVDAMIARYQSKGLLLDSNLLLLQLVGSIEPALIGRAKLSAFDIDQFRLLVRLISMFRRQVTTAHVLAEVSNLVNDFHEAGKLAIWTAFVQHLEVVEEQSLSSYVVARRPEFRYLGLTDTALSTLAQGFLVVSNDGRMVNQLRAIKLDALKWVEILGI